MTIKTNELLVAASAYDQKTENLFKTADANAFYRIVLPYEDNGSCVRDFAHALKMSAESFKNESDMNNPYERRIHALLLAQAKIIEDTLPDVQSIDEEIQDMHSKLDSGGNPSEASGA